MVFENLVLFLLSCIALVVSGAFVVRSLVKIANFLRIKEFTAAFLIMTFSTSLPETFVGISSALAKNPSLSLGTVIGSNIVNLTLIAGIAVVLARGLKVESKSIKKDAFWMVLMAFIPMALMFIGGQLSRLDGALLMVIFVIHTLRLLKEGKKFTAGLTGKIKRPEIVLAVLLFVVSAAVLYLSSRFVVHYGTVLAVELLLPPIFIGLFLLAIGTSLPELVFETQSALAKHPGLTLGNLLGSVIVNSTFVLGITALIHPITADFFLFLTSAVFMVIVCFIFATFVESGREISWHEGIGLIMLYVFFLIVELSLKGITIPNPFG